MRERCATKIIRIIDERNEFVRDVDGFLYYFPTVGGGHFSSDILRIIADELDKRNKPWQDQIEKDFEALPEFQPMES